ncbi:hypothetical protein LTR95_012814 [Oleoguttula sp. CCFEE 5521]
MPSSNTSSDASSSSTKSVSSKSSRSTAASHDSRWTNRSASSTIANAGDSVHIPPMQHHSQPSSGAWPFDNPTEDLLAHVGAGVTPNDQRVLDEVVARSQHVLHLPRHVINGREAASWNHLVGIDPLAAELDRMLTTGTY